MKGALYDTKTISLLQELLPLAKDPTLAPERLAWLARSELREVCRALVQNPSTPPSVLYSLAERHPEDFLQNPLFPLLLLEDPSLESLPEGTLAALCRLPSIPVSLLAKHAFHSSNDVQDGIAQNPSTPPELLTRLLEEGGLLGERAVQNPSTPQEVKALYHRAQKAQTSTEPLLSDDELRRLLSGTEWMRGLAAQNPYLTQEGFAQLSQDPSFSIRGLLAENRSLPAELVALLSKDAEPWVRGKIARREDPTEDIVAALSQDPEETVRSAIAANPRTPPALLRRLAVDEENNVRYEVWRNPSAPQAELSLLLRAGSKELDYFTEPQGALTPEEQETLFAWGPYARLLLARHPQTPPEMLARLLPEEEAARLAAGNPNAPPEMLEKLAQHPNQEVRWQIALNPNAPEEMLARLACDPRAGVRQCTARHPKLTATLFPRLASDPCVEVRQGIALNPSAPLEVLEGLASDPEAPVRLSLAARSELPPSVLFLLLGDEEREVRQKAAKHPNAPPEMRTLFSRAGASPDFSHKIAPDRTLDPESLFLLSHSGPFAQSLAAIHPNTPAFVRLALSESEDLYVRGWVAKSPFSPAWLLEKLSLDANEEIRFWVADNPRCPPSVLARLSQDRCPGVRKAVAAHPKTPQTIAQRLSQDPSLFVRYGCSLRKDSQTDSV